MARTRWSTRSRRGNVEEMREETITVEERVESEKPSEDERKESEERSTEEEKGGENEESESEEQEGGENKESEIKEQEGEENEEGRNEEGEEENDSEDSSKTEPPIQPLGMYFKPAEYNKKIKIGTRCFIQDVVNTLGSLKHPLTNAEEKWFHEHTSFKHIWHFPMERNYTHKLMGMWMLLLRTTRIEKEKEVWFLVNGVPIRYGIKEHALISGFNCRNYPVDYDNVGTGDFEKRHFRDAKNPIQFLDVRLKLQTMDGTERYQDRLRMAVLFLLCGIVKAQTKQGTEATAVEPFLLRAVDNLHFCKDFPWGRYTFDHMLGEIKHTMDHFRGTVKVGSLWPIPGFCIPLELLAFEAIPKLGNCFREDVSRGDKKCPRMCKKCFKKGYLNGFSLSKVNEELGSTQEIDGILPIREEEKSLMDEITEAEDDDDRHDIVVESWMRCFSKGQSVRFDEMFEQDVAARGAKETEAIPAILAAETPRNVTVAEVVDILNSMKVDMKKIVDKVDGLDQRLTSLVKEVKEVGEKSKAAEDRNISTTESDKEGPIAPQRSGVKRPGAEQNRVSMGRKTRSKNNKV